MIVSDICDVVIATTVKPVEHPVRLVLLDVGISNSLSEKDFKNLKDTMSAVTHSEVQPTPSGTFVFAPPYFSFLLPTKHYYFSYCCLFQSRRTAELIFDHAVDKDVSNREDFIEELSQIVDFYSNQALNLGSVQVSDLISQVFVSCSRHRVKLEANFTSILLATFVIEGLGRSLDPDLDVIAKASKYLS